MESINEEVKDKTGAVIISKLSYSVSPLQSSRCHCCQKGRSRRRFWRRRSWRERELATITSDQKYLEFRTHISWPGRDGLEHLHLPRWSARQPQRLWPSWSFLLLRWKCGLVASSFSLSAGSIYFPPGRQHFPFQLDLDSFVRLSWRSIIIRVNYKS